MSLFIIKFFDTFSGLELQKKLNYLSDQRDSLLKRSDKVLAKVEEFSAENEEILNDIGCVRGVTQYSVWIQLIEDQSNETSIAVESGNREDIVKCYLIIKDIEQELSHSKVLLHHEFRECMFLFFFSANI